MFLLLHFSYASDTNGIFSNYYHQKIVEVAASGSSKQTINGTLQFTKPEYSVYPFDKRYDWCSNCGETYDDKPWIAFSLKNKLMKINQYFIRCGCCYERCCCQGEKYGCYRCCLYSWSLQISNDNKTWTDVHKVEKDNSMRLCNEKTFKLDKEYTAKYVRIIQNEPCPGDPPCIAINKIDFFGDVLDDGFHVEEDFVSFHDDDEDVSIIGHISKNINAQRN